MLYLLDKIHIEPQPRRRRTVSDRKQLVHFSLCLVGVKTDKCWCWDLMLYRLDSIHIGTQPRIRTVSDIKQLDHFSLCLGGVKTYKYWC